MASLLMSSSGGGSISLMAMAGSVADVRGTFRLEDEFSELSKRINWVWGTKSSEVRMLKI